MLRCAIIWISIALYAALAMGLPLPQLNPADNRSGKNTSQPFPCMDSPCGCRSAEQCWRHCCCHSLAERIAWARQHHVQPPDDVLAEAKSEGIAVDECCDDEQAKCGHQRQPTSAKHGSHVVLVKMLECQGLAGHWLAAVISLPPPAHVRWSLSRVNAGCVPATTFRAFYRAIEPATPPPRCLA